MGCVGTCVGVRVRVWVCVCVGMCVGVWGVWVFSHLILSVLAQMIDIYISLQLASTLYFAQPDALKVKIWCNLRTLYKYNNYHDNYRVHLLLLFVRLSLHGLWQYQGGCGNQLVWVCRLQFSAWL